MSLYARISALLCVVAVSASMAFAGVNVDGVIDGNDAYDFKFDDAGDSGAELFAGTGLDIESFFLGWDQTASSYYLALTAANGQALDTDGDGSMPFARPSLVQVYILQANSQHVLEVELFNDAVVSTELNFAPMLTGQYQAAVNGAGAVSALEVSIKDSALIGFDPNASTEFYVVFDGKGGWSDDVLQAHLPEPATMSVVLMGGMGFLLRRRKNA